LNRIVIIGNGFDLAHGLPTKYSDFLEYLKNDIFETGIKTEDRDSNELIIRKTNQKGGVDPWIALKFNKEKLVPANNHGCQYVGSANVKKYDFIVPRQNKTSILYASLFEPKAMDENWSDLESHYFRLISAWKDDMTRISSINEEFSHLKNLLEDYLHSQIEENIIINNQSINKDLIEIIRGKHIKYSIHDTFVISFNYTHSLLKEYLDKSLASLLFGFEAIHIHGRLKDNENPIIFGYGDDNSTEYQKIKNIKNNELLHNFKTFQYLRLSQYEQILGLLESDKEIYIQIIGHSCGMGDKTLLRTIFQHENVKKIESHYHDSQKQYFENLYNISRIFDETELMRDKVLNLKDTIPLPEIGPISFLNALPYQ
jgi:hypothetical protein